jgi:hypothetical protein
MERKEDEYRKILIMSEYLKARIRNLSNSDLDKIEELIKNIPQNNKEGIEAAKSIRKYFPRNLYKGIKYWEKEYRHSRTENTGDEISGEILVSLYVILQKDKDITAKKEAIKRVKEIPNHMKFNILKIVTFITLFGLLMYVGLFVLTNPMTLDLKILTQLVQGVCLFVITSLLGLSEIESSELKAGNVVTQIGKWTLLFLPLSLLGLQYNYSIIFQYANMFLFLLNFIVWVIFSSSYTSEINSRRQTGYSFGAIMFTSIWLLISVANFVGDNRYFHFATESLNKFESIHYLLKFKILFIISFGIYSIIYVVSNISGEDNPAIPKIPFLSAGTNSITSYEWINAIFSGLQYSLNIMISVLNPLIQIIGTVLVYFIYIIPKLILQLILHLGKLSILILPSILILIILLFLIYLVRENASEIVNYIQTNSRQNGIQMLIPIAVYCILSLLCIILIQLVNHFSFKIKSDFSLKLLPFSVTYFLLLLTLDGWAVYGIGKIKVENLQIGFYTIIMSALLLIGIIILIMLQLNLKKTKNKKLSSYVINNKQ